MDEVRRLRKLKGLTQVELAELAGVSAYTVTEIETGHREPRPSTLRKLAAALDAEVADFFPKARRSSPVAAEDQAGEEQDLEEEGRFLADWGEEELRRWEEKIPEGTPARDVTYGALAGFTFAFRKSANYYQFRVRHKGRQDPGLTQRAGLMETLERVENAKQATVRLLKRVHESRTDAEFQKIWEANDLGAIINEPENR